MAKKDRPTKLEEARFRVHLDIDGSKEEALTAGLHKIRQVIQFVIGQEDVENHEVDLEVQLKIKEQDDGGDEQ